MTSFTYFGFLKGSPFNIFHVVDDGKLRENFSVLLNLVDQPSLVEIS